MRLPIFWRYALSHFLRVFTLSVATFVAILLVLRFKEIARFAALTANWTKAGIFTVYQIPFILPMAIPLSALIASFLVVERMSASNELNALRSARMSLGQALMPLWVAGCFLSALGFAICADVAPFCRRAAKDLVYHTTSSNPLFVLQRQTQKNIFVDFDMSNEGKKVRNLTLIGYLNRHKRLNLISASELRVRDEQLMGRKVALVSNLVAEGGFDSLIVENHDAMSVNAPHLSAALRKNRIRQHDINASSLQQLLTQRFEGGSRGKKAWFELFRRYSLVLSCITFTVLGSAFGIDQARGGRRRSLFVPLSLTLFLLSSYFLGKAFKANSAMTFLIYALPHPIAWLASWRRLARVNAGRTC